MWKFAKPAPKMIARSDALPGRPGAIATSATHFLTGNPLAAAPVGAQTIVVAMGCFWGAERRFWKQQGATWALRDGIASTAVGYAGGFTPNPTYEEVCSGLTGHTEVVKVDYLPDEIELAELLAVFWEGHDPTQGMRQGNDVGTQYRSALYTTTPAQAELVARSRDVFQARLTSAGLGEITTDLAPLDHFYFAEAYHQQYLAKNPNGYCGLGGTGVTCPVGPFV